MRRSHVLLSVIGSLVLILFATASLSFGQDRAASLALTGKVNSSEEGSMEGVLVSARKAGATFTVTVVSNDQGRYSFPRDRLAPGQYTLSIRAGGYDLDDPGAIQVSPQKTTTTDLKLHKTQNIAAQLSSAEWAASVPGTPEEKQTLIGCAGCHSLTRPLTSHHTAEEFMAIFTRMSSYAGQTSPEHPQLQMKSRRRAGATDDESLTLGRTDRLRKQAEWLASINLSKTGTWNYPLKTFPRPKGRATHVIYTEYDLLRPDIMPHDAVMGPDGLVYYTDFGTELIGSLDPKTGKVVEYPVPSLKQGVTQGVMGMDRDKQGYLWVALLAQGAIGRFDTRTKKLDYWSLPPDWNTDAISIAQLSASHSEVDGKVWMDDAFVNTIHRLDIKTGKFDSFELYKDLPDKGKGHTVYGVFSDSHNNAYWADLGGGNIGRIDAETGKIKIFAPPTPNSAPRRGYMDSQDRIWFGETRGNNIGMFDTRTEKFQEWPVPTPWSAPYDAILDKNGDVWVGGETNDLVTRMNSKTGEFIQYLCPKYTAIRKVFVDESKKSVAFWVANNHGSTLLKVEPLD